MKWSAILRLCGGTMLLLASCATPPTLAPPISLTTAANDAESPQSHAPQTQSTAPLAPAPTAARQPLGFSKSKTQGVWLQGVAFDARQYRLHVVDQKNGPGSQFPDAAAAARSHGGIAAVNGGFFTPEGAPLGRVIAGGTMVGTWNRSSSLGSALWIENQAGSLSIVRRSAAVSAVSTSARNLLQAGPLLIDQGRIVAGLENRKHSARTFLLWDGGLRWWMGCASPVTLAGLADILKTNPPVTWKPTMALNLDGGRSSELWVSSRLHGAEISTRLPWNRAVRNFLVLAPRN